MRFHELNKHTLLEGGNIFKGELATRRILKAEVPKTIQYLEMNGVTGIKFPMQRWLGSTGRKESSGDLDLAVDTNEISKDELYAKLIAWCKRNKEDPKNFVRKSGISVHFRCPIIGAKDGGFVQVDFMMTDNPNWMAWSTTADQPSKFKDTDRQILINSIAKSLGLKWVPHSGLFSRESGNLVSNDPQQIADYLLGSGAKPSELKSVENILARLQNDPDFEAKVADARKSIPHIFE